MGRYPYLGVNNGQFVFVLISKDGNHIRHNIELGQKYQIEVSQLYDDDSGTYMYDITVDGQTIAGNKGSGTIATEKAFVVTDATVYLSTDFQYGTAADATVEWFYLESWVQWMTSLFICPDEQFAIKTCEGNELDYSHLLKETMNETTKYCLFRIIGNT